MTATPLVALVPAFNAMLNDPPAPLAMIPAATQLGIERVKNIGVDRAGLLLTDERPKVFGRVREVGSPW